MRILELFCGHAEISRAFKESGHTVISVDNRKRKGICEPVIHADILQLSPGYFSNVDIIWASPPCTAFSYGAGNYYYDNGRPKERTQYFIHLLNHTLYLIKTIKPKYFFIENPRGRMRYLKSMIDFMADQNACIKTLTLSSYGFPTTKPTDIITNAHHYMPKPMHPYGRGNKNQSGMKLSGLTTTSSQRTPKALAREIVNFCEKNVPGTLLF
jgi:site-specific DNA-cytosine methylase